MTKGHFIDLGQRLDLVTGRNGEHRVAGDGCTLEGSQLLNLSIFGTLRYLRRVLNTSPRRSGFL